MILYCSYQLNLSEDQSLLLCGNEKKNIKTRFVLHLKRDVESDEKTERKTEIRYKW